MSETAERMPEPLRRLLERLAGRQASDVVCDADDMAWQERVADDALARERYTLVLGVAPFAGTYPGERVAPLTRALAASRRAELVALAWTVRALAPGGRAFLVVPPSLLGAQTHGHRQLRRHLVDACALQAVLRLPPGWYKPRAAAAVLAFAKAASANVTWFGELAPPSRSGRARTSGDGDTAADPALERWMADWQGRTRGEAEAQRSASSFAVTRSEIAAAGYHLGIERYRKPEPRVPPASARPQELLHQLAALEAEIFEDLRRLVGMLR